LRTATLSHPEYRTRVTFDGHGARRGKGPAWNPATGALVLGDSFTFGVGVSDEEAWPGLWAEASGRPVLNLGAPGSTLTDQLAIVEARHREVGSPRRCIFAMFLGNDLAELAARRRPAPAQATQADPPLVSRLNAWSYRSPLTRRSYLFQLARSAAVGAWNASRPVPAVDLAFAAMRRDAPDAAETIEALADAAAGLKDQQSRLGYSAVVMLIPDRYQVLTSLRDAKAREYGIPLASLEPARPARLVSGAMRAAGIHVVDTSRCLADAGARAYYVQDNHLTASGQARLAACAAALLGPLF
jgi:hypothetical protein